MLAWLGKLGALASQSVNALILGGSPNESISGRAYRENWRIRRAIDRLFFWEPDHCRKAHESDLAFARLILSGEAS